MPQSKALLTWMTHMKKVWSSWKKTNSKFRPGTLLRTWWNTSKVAAPWSVILLRQLKKYDFKMPHSWLKNFFTMENQSLVTSCSSTVGKPCSHQEKLWITYLRKRCKSWRHWSVAEFKKSAQHLLRKNRERWAAWIKEHEVFACRFQWQAGS